jgi:hypothetical protein
MFLMDWADLEWKRKKRLKAIIWFGKETEKLLDF